MSFKPDNAVQLYVDVQKASGKSSPLHPDFYKVALDREDQPLVQALNSISENDFLKPERIVSKLNEKHFAPKRKRSRPKSWVEEFSQNKKPTKERSR